MVLAMLLERLMFSAPYTLCYGFLASSVIYVADDKSFHQLRFLDIIYMIYLLWILSKTR